MSIITKLGLGTVQFGIDYGISNTFGKTTSEEVSKILNYASEKNINLIDTAISYGNAEEELGTNSLRQFKIVSKFILDDENNSVDIENQLNTSLNNLNLQSIYGYLAHRPLSVLKDKSVWKALEVFKSEGKVEKIGFSFNDISELDRILDSGIIPDLIQVPFNYFDQRFKNHMIILKSKGCEIHTRSTFLQGLFFCQPENLNSHFDQIKSSLLKLQSYNNRLPALLLRWVLKHQFIDKVIVGVNNLEQLRNNLISLENELEDLEDYTNTISDNILIPSLWPKK